jgi:cellulose synthase/poly-beta-1,6-N-acetylglucosamine synthase-like glycosyltransferase
MQRASQSIGQGFERKIEKEMIDLALLYTIFRFFYYAVFVGLHVCLMLGIFLEWLREKKSLNIAAGELPAVSVVIPVHNESKRIEGLLRSLGEQDYPRTECIFIDDRSEDESANLIAAFIESKGVRLSTRVISLKENPGPNFKQFALARGIELSSGEFLLFTDADCVLPPSWIRGMVKRMSDDRVGAVIGPVLKQSEGKGFFNSYQCFDHGIRYVYLAGATGLGAAGGGFGNNLILRRACLDAVGGYDRIPPSPTEDAALISIIRASTDYKIRAALGADVHVITHGENTWKSLINQTLRWNNGGLFSPDAATRFNYNFLMITISMGILTIPLLPFLPSIWPLPAGVQTAMIFNTIANLSLFGVSLPKRKFTYVFTLIFTPAYFTLLTILGYFRVKPKWKGKII